ncbi:MAG: hypothetical protein EPO06_11730 [Burkholderiaceae bacterium]|nr:MAG: hypothetical protein EPO06_11730 [Burkholderiaceae bacterium]
MNPVWSYLLAATGVTGLLIAANRPRVGYWFNIAAQGAWLAYAIATRQWGFLLSVVAYTVAFARLLRRAYRTADVSTADQRAALRDELVHLWHDLSIAWSYESRADPRESSSRCEGLIGRIHAITRLVGPVSSDDVSMPFLLTGMYEQVHAGMGISVQVPEETLRRCREYVASQRAPAS